jgi:hypothetical protein
MAKYVDRLRTWTNPTIVVSQHRPKLQDGLLDKGIETEVAMVNFS